MNIQSLAEKISGALLTLASIFIFIYEAIAVIFSLEMIFDPYRLVGIHGIDQFLDESPIICVSFADGRSNHYVADYPLDLEKDGSKEKNPDAMRDFCSGIYIAQCWYESVL